MKGCTQRKAAFALAAAIAGDLLLARPVRAGVPLTWDPNPAAGIQGGFGTWNTSNTNWDNGGVPTVWFNSHNDTAIFSGLTGGNVQMPSAITADAIEFDTAGYVVGTTPSLVLTLNSGSVIANVDASIAAAISTPGGLFKTGAGVLTMLGSGTIHGNLSVVQGTLAFSTDTQLGGTTNDVELSGGTLRYAGGASFTLGAGHSMIVDAAGGTIETPSARLLLGAAGQISGTGTLLKMGAQPLQIAAANTGFSGSFNVGEGTAWLQDAKGINGRPIILSGGGLLLRGDQPIDFQSPVNVLADGTINSDHISPQGMVGQSHSLGDVSVAAGATLSVVTSTNNFLRVHQLSLAGGLVLGDSGVMVGGAFSGTGAVSFSAMFQAPEMFSSGLIFSNGLSQTISNSLSPVAGSAGPVVGVDVGTAVTFDGVWAGGADGARGAVVLRNGGKLVVGASAHLNTIAADLVGQRPFVVTGIGAGNTFELAPGFIADHTALASVADGFSSLEVRDAALISHASQSLPVVLKQDGVGGVQRAGSLIFSGTSGAKWIVADAFQQYDGGVVFNSSATVQTDSALVHLGIAGDRFDGSFQIPAAGATLTKEGAGSLTLSGDQGYAPGAALKVNAGTVRFNTDPGAGWYAGNYPRGIDGKVTATPAPAGTLAVNIGGGGNVASVLFDSKVARVDSIQIGDKGNAQIVSSAHWGDKTVITHSLAITGDGRFDLGNGRLIVDYTGASPLPAIAGLIAKGFNGGITAGAAGDATMAIGYAQSSDLLHLSPNQTGIIGGASVDASSIVVMLTRVGDADLDGRVTFADFQRFELGFGLAGAGWSRGDFNADGVVDSADFKLLSDNFGKSAEGALSSPVSVPEPSGIALFAGLLVFFRRVRSMPDKAERPSYFIK